MHTRNTTTTTRRGSVNKILFILELLTLDDTQRILDFFRDYQQGSYLDLLVSTQLESSKLEILLERLTKANVLIETNSIYGTEFEVNFHRLRIISKFTKELSYTIPKQALAI